MTALSNLAAQRPLSQTWRDWTAIVQLFANKRPACEQIAETVYCEIHQEVTASLNDMRELDAKTENSGLAVLCDRLNALARPWVTLNALRAADPRITQNLLLLCQAGQTEIDAQIGRAHV